MPEAIRIENNPVWSPYKISPTYLSNNLISPLQLPFRETVPKSNILTEGTASRYLNKQWGCFSSDYGGVGHLPLLGKVSKPRRELPVPRSHRHFQSGLSLTIDDVVTPRVITSLLKSKQRHDEFIPQPTLINDFRNMLEENHFVQEPVYSSHAPRTDMFPRSRAEFDVPGLDRDLVNNYPLSEDTNEALKRIMKNRYKVTSCEQDYRNYETDFKKIDVGEIDQTHRKKKSFFACENPPKHVQKFQSCVSKQETAVPGVWPAWPAGANSIVSNITGKIVEKRDVISLDDQRDFTRYKMAEIFDPRRAKNPPSKPITENNDVHSFGSSKLVPMKEPMFSNCGRFACVNQPARIHEDRPAATKEAWSDLTIDKTPPEYNCCENCRCNCAVNEKDSHEESQFRHTRYHQCLLELEEKRLQRKECREKCSCECDGETKSQNIKRLSERVKDVLKGNDEEVEMSETKNVSEETSTNTENPDEDNTGNDSDEDWEVIDVVEETKPVEKQVTFSGDTEILKHPESKYKCWGYDPRDYGNLNERSKSERIENQKSEPPKTCHHAPFHTSVFEPMGSQRYGDSNDPFKGGRPVRNKDACSLNLQLDRDEETCGLLFQSAQLQDDKVNKYIEQMSQKRKQEKNDLDKEFPVSNVKLPPRQLWETLDYAGGRVADRLGVRYKTIAYKRYHSVHPEPIPDLRDFRQPLRKSKFLGYHTSIFR